MNKEELQGVLNALEKETSGYVPISIMVMILKAILAEEN